MFAKVIAVDASEAFLRDNRMHNKDRVNILYAHLHSRLDGLQSLRYNDVHVAMVDAEHDYESVFQDVQQLLRFFGSTLRYLIFDDYATDEGVKEAVAEFTQKGQLKIVGGVGQRPPWSYHGKVVHSWEGVICEVLPRPPTPQLEEAAASDVKHPIIGPWYSWIVDSLCASDDVIEFQSGGGCATSRGPGRWWADKNEKRGVWLSWPSHKPASLGGSDKPQVEESWYLHFDEDWQKFAAARVDGGKQTAAGMTRSVFDAMLRRLFVSLSHEFCTSANECYFRPG
eukprot:TRINITY_DN21551_c0_g1_i1.p1 TRINITY_DN21551_c0_g1~~TRINITY_DN21551_c0_g1_i1.p1  ORF type:complete len:323 (-),score=50.68 TRINITY_DN21551_c0_g1_i1:99-947(-)